MNHDYRKAKISALGVPQNPNYPEYPFSGETGFFGGGYGPPQSPVPFQSGNPGGPGFGGFSFNEIKTMIDRMGGIDGVLNMLQKANKMMQTIQQMAPMFKLVFSSLGGKAKTADTYSGDVPRRRRRRRKSGSRNRNRTGGRSRNRYY